MLPYGDSMCSVSFMSTAIPPTLLLVPGAGCTPPLGSENRRVPATLQPGPRPLFSSLRLREERESSGYQGRKALFYSNWGNCGCICNGRVWELFLKDWKEFPLLISMLSQSKSN